MIIGKLPKINCHFVMDRMKLIETLLCKKPDILIGTQCKKHTLFIDL